MGWTQQHASTSDYRVKIKQRKFSALFYFNRHLTSAGYEIHTNPLNAQQYLVMTALNAWLAQTPWAS